jgi:hypothetical protein
MLTLVALVGGTAVVGSTSIASAKSTTPVKKLATAPALYKISSYKTTAPPPGCVGQGCPQQEQSLPALDKADTAFDALVGAKKIDTYSTWNNGTTIKGGCAIKSDDTLACWGFNGYGQLGDGTSTDSSAPVAAVGLGKVIDVSTNGFTTCAVTVDNALKCVGKGDWEGFTKLQINGNSTTRTYTWNNGSQSYVEGDPVSANVQECQVSSGTKIVSTTQWCNNSQNNFTKDWVTIPNLSGVVKARLQGSQGWQNSGLCIMKTDGTVACNKVEPGKEGTGVEKNGEEFDCNNDGEFETPRGNDSLSRDCFNEYRPGQPPTSIRANGSIAVYKKRWGWRRETPYPAPTWEWKDAGLTKVVDFVVADQSFGGSDGTMCAIAGDDKSVTCKTFTAANFDWNLQKTTGGTWGAASVIKGAYNAEAIYMTSFNGLGLCVYAQGTLSCGTATWSNNSMQFPTEVSSVAVMEKPVSIFAQQSINKVFFMTKSGILSADQWALGCNGCYKPASGATLTGVTAFLPAENATFYSLDSVTGSSDNPDYIPIVLSTGERLVKSQKVVTVTASDGTPLSGASVRWTLLDKPEYLGSSTKATDTTDADGKVTLAQLATGPVGFTLKGGTLKDGSYLQAGLIVVEVPATGSISVVVPVGKPVVDRSVSVVLTDGTAVPNAVITLRNNYLTYNYANNGKGNSSWSATAPDTKGFMGSAQCSFCFVPPPTYITGADGKVTWKSFQPESRSSQYDAEVVYDDGALNQKVRVIFSGSNADATTTGVDTKVTMPFMAVVKAADTLPAEVTPKADGSVEMPVSMKNEDNEPISGKEAAAEEVCGEMKVGGLWSGTSSVQEGYCEGRGPGSTSGGIPGTTSPVSKSGVNSFACSSSGSVKSDSKGSATVKICPTKSGYFRVKTSGFLPSKTVCVKVNNQPCTVKLQNSIAGQASSTGSTTSGGTSLTGGATTDGSTASAAPKSVKAKGKLATSQFLKAFTPKTGAGSIKVTASGACKVAGKNVVAGAKKGVCRVTVTQAAKGKVKGTKKVFTVKVS